MDKVLEVKKLKTLFHLENRTVTAVDEVSFDLKQGQTLGLVGESGCGKSVTSLSIMQLVPSPPGDIASGEIIFEGKNILELEADELRKVRGDKISMIFQEPMTSLNPVYKIGVQLMEGFTLHREMDKEQAFKESVKMLELVGIPEAEKRMEDYPHQLSGGMRQRVMIAMALSFNPSVLIADEPTTALDVTIQAQILDLINKLQKELGMAVILITHDLAVVAETCDYVNVMYAGKIVEKSPVRDLFKKPAHPYTQGLLGSIPSITQENQSRDSRLDTIPGIVPDISNLPPGCRFSTRCKYAQDRCKKELPELRPFGADREVACFYPLDQDGVSS